jgi:hypothetical protein
VEGLLPRMEALMGIDVIEEVSEVSEGKEASEGKEGDQASTSSLEERIKQVLSRMWLFNLTYTISNPVRGVLRCSVT